MIEEKVELAVLPDLTRGMTVEFDDVLSVESRRLMEVLGVTAIEPEPYVLYHVPANQVWPNSRGGRGRIHLYINGAPLCRRTPRYSRELNEGESAPRCKACCAVATRRSIEWPA